MDSAWRVVQCPKQATTMLFDAYGGGEANRVAIIVIFIVIQLLLIFLSSLSFLSLRNLNIHTKSFKNQLYCPVCIHFEFNHYYFNLYLFN
jgi:hypothetical protein